MKTYKYLATFCFFVYCIISAQAQDYSNKGKDFWIGYGNHVRMFNAGQSEKMQLYITSDVNTTGQVTISSIGFSQNFTITANQITTIDIPRSAALMDDGLYNHGIHVTAAKPVVVYSFIYYNAISGATVCLPSNTLGQDYYSVNFTQTSNEPYSYSYFFVIAADTGKTTVEITPSAVTKSGKPAGIPFNVELQQGQVYQVLGATTGGSGSDLTGSKVRSVNQGAGCKRIAVYCGSGKMSIGCSSPATADNLYQQMYPLTTWGKKYITVNGLNNSTNYYRIVKSDPSAIVKLNGVIIPSSSFVNNFYYQYISNQPDVIEADKPILVAQYFTSQGCLGNTSSSGSDPEMIYLNPVEQTISSVTLNSMQPASGTNITNHFLNVVLKKGGSSISSFKVDGMNYSNFTTVPNDNNYAYARIPVAQGTHTVTCDTGFNIIAYGFGNAESYGYSGGTNLKDLYQYISIKNQYSTVSFPATCVGSPFDLSMVFPYQPTKIQWQFNGLFTDTTIDVPVYDSTWMINGKQIYRYKLPTSYNINSSGTYPIKVIAKNPTPDGCSGEQEITFDLQVYDKPKASFTFQPTACLGSAIQFTDNTNTSGVKVNKWDWDLGDGTNNSSKSFSHLYSASGVKEVKLSIITEVGCISDTAKQQVNIFSLPSAAFTISGSLCVGSLINFTDASTTEASPIVKWYWDFGDGSAPVAATSNIAQSHIYIRSGVFTATLKVENAAGCQSSVFSQQITIHNNPVADFEFGTACLPSGAMQFTAKPTLNGANLDNGIYYWDFGDGVKSDERDPVHNYASAGSIQVKFLITSSEGCGHSIVKTVNTIYDQPKAAFNIDKIALCLGEAFTLTGKSSAPASTVKEFKWDFGDGTSSGNKDFLKTFSSAGTYSIKLSVTSEVGCLSDTTVQTVVVNALPEAVFTISNPSCEGQALHFTDASNANSGNIIKWNWKMGDGTTSIKNTNSAFDYTYAVANNHLVSLQVETDKGCISSELTKNLAVHAMPLVGFDMPGSCLTDPYSQFTDTTKILDGSQGQFSFLWNFGDGNATVNNPNTSTLQSPKHKYSATGGYDVSLTVTSNNGCVASITQNFFVNGAVPQSAFDIVGNTHCSNNEVGITNQSSVDVGRIVKMEIYWDYDNDPTSKSVVAYPKPGNIYTNKYTEFYTPATKQFKIMVVAYSGENCLSTSFQTITLNATPEIVFSKIPPVCADVAPFLLTQATVVNGLQGIGVYAGPGVNTSGNFNPAAAGVGVHTIKYTYTAGNTCSNFKEETIEVYPVPIVNAGANMYVLEGDSIQLKGKGEGKNISYQWSPSNWLSNATIPNPYTSPKDDINYLLSVVSEDGCSAKDDVFIKVLKMPVIPNTFSPNGDGVHDKWMIPNIDDYPGATVEIYNRYGQLIFQSKGYSKPWDGTFNGKPAPVGTYYYLINPRSGRKQIAGFVDIIR